MVTQSDACLSSFRMTHTHTHTLADWWSARPWVAPGTANHHRNTHNFKEELQAARRKRSRWTCWTPSHTLHHAPHTSHTLPTLQQIGWMDANMKEVKREKRAEVRLSVRSPRTQQRSLMIHRYNKATSSPQKAAEWHLSQSYWLVWLPARQHLTHKTFKVGEMFQVEASLWVIDECFILHRKSLKRRDQESVKPSCWVGEWLYKIKLLFVWLSCLCKCVVWTQYIWPVVLFSFVNSSPLLF